MEIQPQNTNDVATCSSLALLKLERNKEKSRKRKEAIKYIYKLRKLFRNEIKQFAPEISE